MSLLPLLWALPILVVGVSLRIRPTYLYTAIATSFGIVISPASQELYSLYFLGKWAAIVGIIGLPLVLLHGAPGSQFARHLELLNSPGVVTGSRHYMVVESLNGIFWGLVYGGLGFAVDRMRNRAPKSGRSH